VNVKTFTPAAVREFFVREKAIGLPVRFIVEIVIRFFPLRKPRLSPDWRPTAAVMFAANGRGGYAAGMVHENLAASIEDLSSRIIAIRDSL
jgi:hypothetical protein